MQPENQSQTPQPTPAPHSTPVSLPVAQQQMPTTSSPPVPQPVAPQPFTPQSASGGTTPIHSNKRIIIAIAGVGIVLLLTAIIAAIVVVTSHNKKAETQAQEVAAATAEQQKQDKKLTEVIKLPTPTSSTSQTPGTSTPATSGYLSAAERESFFNGCKSSSLNTSECACLLNHFETTMTATQFEEFGKQVARDFGSSSGQISDATWVVYQKGFDACNIAY